MKALTVLLTALALTGSVVVAAGGDEHKTTFKSLDKNRNGTLNVEEAKSGGISEESFKQLDVNADEALDWNEFAALYSEDSGNQVTSDEK